MSETVLRILLSELSVIRAKCLSCGMVVELPIAKAGPVMDKCAGCGREHGNGILDIKRGIESRFQDLSQAISNLNDVKQSVQVEFTLTIEKPTTQS